MKIEFLNEAILDAIEDIPENYLKMDIDKLREEARIRKTDELLRDSFWAEYERACYDKRKMVANKIYSGICGRAQWHNKLHDVGKMSYILRAPQSYLRSVQTLLRMYAHKTYEEILGTDMEEPVYNKVGELIGHAFSPKIATLKMKVLESLANRVEGMPVQKIEEKKFEVKVEALGMEELEKQVAQLDAELKGAMAAERKQVELIPGPTGNSPVRTGQGDIEVPRHRDKVAINQDDMDEIKRRGNIKKRLEGDNV